MQNPFRYGSIVTDEHFADRHNELTALLKIIRLGESALISGPLGIGKSSLCAELARRHFREFVFIHLDFTGVVDEKSLFEILVKESMRASYGSIETFPSSAWALLPNPSLRQVVLDGLGQAPPMSLRRPLTTHSDETHDGTNPSARDNIRSCPRCGGPTKWVEKYSMHYCYNCKKYAPTRRRIRIHYGPGLAQGQETTCPRCGKEMRFSHRYSTYHCPTCDILPLQEGGKRKRVPPTRGDMADAFDIPERIANDKGSRIVVIMDEFQASASLEENNTLKMMAERLEMHENVSYLFTCTSREFSRTCFEEKRSPFRHFAEIMRLGPIPEEPLRAFLIDRFSKAKGRLSDELAQIVADISGGYPSGAQEIAHELFHISSAPSVKSLEDAVGAATRHHAASYSAIWDTIKSPLHKKYLLALASDPKTQHGDDFAARHGLRSKSHVQRIEGLLEAKGLLADGEISDPLLAIWLKSISSQLS